VEKTCSLGVKFEGAQLQVLPISIDRILHDTIAVLLYRPIYISVALSVEL